MIKTEYRGYSIHFSENADHWTCNDCDVSDQSLQKVKDRIDRLHLKMRKDSAYGGWELHVDRNKYAVGMIQTKVIDYIGLKPARSWDREKGEVHMVAAMAKRSGRERAGRQEMKVGSICPDDPAVFKAVEEANRLGHLARVAIQAFNDQLAAIPRLTIDEIGGLVEASGHKFTEGED